jgi:hypothetical protein
MNQNRGSGEGEAASGVVDYVDLAGVLAGFEAAEWDVELECDGVARGFVELGGFDEWCFEGFGAAVEKFDAGENSQL